MKQSDICPIKDQCPYEYDACYNPKKYCRIIEDTPEHFTRHIR